MFQIEKNAVIYMFILGIFGFFYILFFSSSLNESMNQPFKDFQSIDDAMKSNNSHSFQRHDDASNENINDVNYDATKETQYFYSTEPTQGDEELPYKNISFSRIESLTPSNLTLEFWKEVSENFKSPLILPPKWTSQNDLEFAVKFRGAYMGYPFQCKEEKGIPLKKRTAWYCEVDGLNPNGTLVALSIGNSFSMNIISAISSHPSIKKVINVYVNAAQFPVHDDHEEFTIEKMIKRLKPNVTLLIHRYYDGYLYTTPIDKIQEHKEFKHWNKVLEEISKYTSAIIINKEQIVFPYDISQDYIRKKFYGLPIETKLKNPPASPNLEAWLNALNCSKCGFYSYREAFCDGEFCQIMDLATGLPVYKDTEHISPIGVRHIKPLIDKEINRILNITVSN